MKSVGSFVQCPAVVGFDGFGEVNRGAGDHAPTLPVGVKRQGDRAACAVGLRERFWGGPGVWDRLHVWRGSDAGAEQGAGFVAKECRAVKRAAEHCQGGVGGVSEVYWFAEGQAGHGVGRIARYNTVSGKLTDPQLDGSACRRCSPVAATPGPARQLVKHMREIRIFIAGLFDNWVTGFCGPASAILAFAGFFVQQVTYRRIVFASAGICAVAFYRMWLTEFRLRTKPTPLQIARLARFEPFDCLDPHATLLISLAMRSGFDPGTAPDSFSIHGQAYSVRLGGKLTYRGVRYPWSFDPKAAELTVESDSKGMSYEWAIGIMTIVAKIAGIEVSGSEVERE